MPPKVKKAGVEGKTMKNAGKKGPHHGHKKMHGHHGHHGHHHKHHKHGHHGHKLKEGKTMHGHHGHHSHHHGHRHHHRHGKHKKGGMKKLSHEIHSMGHHAKKAMLGESVAVGVEACQSRCKKDNGCEGVMYFKADGNCRELGDMSILGDSMAAGVLYADLGLDAPTCMQQCKAKGAKCHGVFVGRGRTNCHLVMGKIGSVSSKKG